jgi:hypothetical protein
VEVVGRVLILSPSDLNGFLACPRLTALELAVARDELQKLYRVSLHAELIRREGDEHERRYVSAPPRRRQRPSPSFRPPEKRKRPSAAGAHVIYQAGPEHVGWRGIADFLMRLPDGSYEVVDTKLAGHARPEQCSSSASTPIS